MGQDTDLNEQIVALSALMLAVDGVDALAHKGQWAQENFTALLPSLIRFNAPDVLSYYDHTHCLEHGRELLIAFLRKELTMEKIRYALQLMHVENKLAKNARLMQSLQKGLTKAHQQTAHYELSHDNVIANFAHLYAQTASLAASKIMVQGSPTLLQQQSIVNQIRTLLLCGIRASALWRANGGSRLQLLFARGGVEARAKSVSFDSLRQ